MTFQIIWDEQATDAAVRFLKDDPDGLRQVFSAVDLLADDPRPTGTFSHGYPNTCRLRVGFYRVLYEIDDATVTIAVLHPGRTA
ncbi:type II toxin-antitoxin system RelE/ParE family toxin [Streptomyces sp. NPDC016845]|uniref:type II toxin-antitoxin system RelE/ParE family toxin n=1 Tax=Streptomyces sp. NPDC016845 TaxID=3364972 RepID=UPI0037B9DA46